MKKFLFGCAMVGCCLALPQLSAEGYYYPSQYNNNQCCYEMDYDGFYIGGNVGVFSHTAYRNDLDGFLTDNSGWSTINTDVTAEVILGYDWQCGCRVLGVVADWNWVNVDNTLNNDPNTVAGSFIESEFDWFTTIRARGGVTVCDTLLYLTIGGAVARFDTTWADGGVSFQQDRTRWGWVGGVGAEFMAFCNWSFGFELLTLQFSEDTRTFTGGGGTFSFGNSDSAFIGRFILNYRFGDLLGCFCN